MSLQRLAVSVAMALALVAVAWGAEAQEDSKSAGAPKGQVKAVKSSPEKAHSERAGSTKITLEKATFGGGCFWCMEAVFEQVKGVKSVVSGYAGGHAPRPFYELVQTGTTGHAEVVQVEYDSSVVTYEQLLKIFFSAHDPTTLNRQGPDAGEEYRSIILYHNDEQKLAAQKMYEKLTATHAFGAPIVTQLMPLNRFFRAERYHQNYYRTHRYDPYCESVIAPKLEMMRYKQATERATASHAEGRDRPE